ncbi:caspase domain-containing protein [Camillea tinctor]|nr:caspase domain-containing protein [Camillea tinctor]
MSSAHFAILLGVEIPRHSPDHPLRGAVEDVVAIKHYLSSSSTPTDVTVLTTQSPNTAHLPTYENVVKALQHVIRCATRGDYIYIHFSGHGTRMKDGLALVLFDPGPLSSKYLYGEVLRSAINQMVIKGMLVTLVLDCCFSGSVLRTGRAHLSEVRYIKYDPAVDHHSNHENPFLNEDEHDTRGASFSLPRGNGPGQRLLDPDGYTVLCACDMHEEASEIEIDRDKSRGALSYFLLESLVALRKRGAQVSHQSLHQHLRASFHAYYPHQTPMMYGRNGLSFFDGLALRRAVNLVSAYRNTQGDLVLDAGEAHGVHESDEYALYPFTTLENLATLARNTYIKSRVVDVCHLTSQLHIVDPSDDMKVENGSSWKAKLLTSLSPHRVKIRLMDSITNSNELMQAACRSPFLSLTREDSGKQAEIHQYQSPAPTIFQVTTNGGTTYEVQDELGVSIANLPPLHIHGNGATQALFKALEHIATYKFFEKIENQTPNPRFESSFSVDCLGRLPKSDGFYEVPDGESLSLTFKNLDNVVKHLVILSFSSSWEIRNLIYDAGEGSSLGIPPEDVEESGELELPLEMKVPDHLLARGSRQTEDIVKIFVTSKPTLFPLMLLPRINDDELRGPQNEMIEYLKDLIWGLSEMRGGDEGEWTTKTFLVRTKL